MRIIDTSGGLMTVFESGGFDINRWKSYIDRYVPGAGELCINDMQECIDAGFSWEKNFLPVLNAVHSDADKREKTIDTFHRITEQINNRLLKLFGKTVDADVIMYLGLCNGAGWVTEFNGRTAILMGIEKIMELDWCDTDPMTGLLFHELGHVYQSQYGRFRIKTDSLKEHFIWKLFTEGVAMVFEQELMGNRSFYQQDVNGWRAWCEQHSEFILASFVNDLETMTTEDQRYFGDWVSFEGYGDTGYYLGTMFVRYMLSDDDFDHIIGYDPDTVKERFEKFCHRSI